MRNYIISIVVAGMICAITDMLLDKKTATGKVAKILTGIFMSVTVFAPLASISFGNITNYFDSLSVCADTFVEDGRNAAQNNISEIIKRQTEAYILDKAKSIGLDVAVEVELDENNSVPCGVTIDGTVSPYAKGVMTSYIEDTLGITREHQRWI